MVLSVRGVSALAVGAMTITAACGDIGAERSPAGIVATTTIWADIVSNVACGAEVASIIPAGADPHTFEPSLRDRELVESASVVIANGSGLEDGLDDLVDIASDRGVTVIEMTTRIDVIEDDDEHDSDDGDAEHEHGGGNPHVWLDPTRVGGAIDLIASAIDVPGLDPADVRKCADAYRTELVELDREIAGVLSAVPPELRLIVTDHDSLAYFADRYDLVVVGTVIPASTTLAEPSAAGLADLALAMTERDVRVVFTEASESSPDAAALADRLGIPAVVLSTDAIASDAEPSTYVAMMRATAATISEALLP